jgi:RNA polymerase sigma-70 factor (ECF subfamily)
MSPVAKEIDLELIRQAQAGSEESTSRLTELAREKVFTYAFRLTFDHHLAQDLAQDTMVEMIRSLSKLQFDAVPSFWAWTYKTALSKVQRHFRAHAKGRQSVRTGVDLDRLPRVLPDTHDLVQEELLRAVFSGMNVLRLEYRNILTLRCMDGLSYAQIASIEGGTELGARLRFFKARNALRRHLVGRGFDGSCLASGLGLLAAATAGYTGATATAAAAVSAASIQIGPVMTAIGLLASKWTFLLVGVAAVALTLVPSVVPPGPPAPPSPPADLLQLVRSGQFAFPSAIIGYAPQQGGSVRFQTWTADPQARKEISPAQWLDSMATDTETHAVLKPGSWIELRLPGPLKDGPGPDLFVATRGCKSIQVLATDGGTRQYPWGGHWCNAVHDPIEILAFDLAGAKVPFEIHAVRLTLLDGVNADLAFEPARVCARIRTE